MTRNNNTFGIKPIKIEPVRLFGEEKKDKRDSRRTFSRTQKAEIWAQQNGKCAGTNCGHRKLDMRTVEYDHVKPWADRGRTIAQNGAALCPECHKLKTHKERLKKVDKKRKQSNEPFGAFNLPKSRSKNPFGL